MKSLSLLLLLLLYSFISFSAFILIPMDEQQKNHLKAYGVTYWILKNQQETSWLLNYRGGSFLSQYSALLEKELKVRGVSYEVVADAKVTNILSEISNTEVNMEIVKLEKVPKIAVYSPKSKLPWDDAVTMVLTYAEIPYDVVYDEEILGGKLPEYDWLHLHHEDFTGQYGRFWSNYRMASWYIDDVKRQEAMATKLGYKKVSDMKLAVATTIKNFCGAGGFLFAMCSGTDSFDIALAATDVDICEHMFDGDAADPQAQNKLDFNKTFAFRDFKLDLNPANYEFSNIDATNTRNIEQTRDFFTLFEFSAKWDVIPTMLTQNHEKVIKGFMGQTTSFKKEFVKPDVLVMGELKSANEARYIHGQYGKGQWTFYGGHDPEDYQHMVGDPPTDLNLFPNSPGYRLILNNILFPAAKKKKQKT